MAIVDDSDVSPERRLQRETILLNNTNTANKILMEVAPGTMSARESGSRKSIGLRPLKGAGAAAVYLTSLDCIAAFEKNRVDDEQLELEKQQKRDQRAENKKKRPAEKAQKQKLKRQKQSAGSKKRKVLGGVSSSHAKKTGYV